MSAKRFGRAPRVSYWFYGPKGRGMDRPAPCTDPVGLADFIPPLVNNFPTLVGR